jgi:type I restriction enzyme S subunit
MKRSNELNLPKGWEIKRLGDIAIVSSGNSAPQKKELFDNGCYPFFRTSDVGKIRKGFISSCVDYLNEDGIKGLKLHKKGTILFPKSGASTFLNHRVLLEIDGYVSSHLATIKGINSISDDRYLLYFLTTFDARNLMQDIAYPSLKTSDIGLISIPLPPLPEQQRIVAILDEAFAKIDKAKANAEQNLKNAKELFESYLQGVFENGNWVNSTLGEVCEFTQGIQRDVKLQSEKQGDNQVRFLRIVDFTQGNEPPRYIDDPGEKYILNDDDVSLVRYGASTGFVCRGLKGALANNLFRVIPKSLKEVSKDFLFVFLNSSVFQNVIRESMNGAAMPAISFGMIKEIPFPIISLKEQQTVVRELNALSIETKKLEVIYKQKIQDLEELKKSVLHKAYSGEL